MKTNQPNQEKLARGALNMRLAAVVCLMLASILGTPGASADWVEAIDDVETPYIEGQCTDRTDNAEITSCVLPGGLPLDCTALECVEGVDPPEDDPCEQSDCEGPDPCENPENCEGSKFSSCHAVKALSWGSVKLSCRGDLRCYEGGTTVTFMTTAGGSLTYANDPCGGVALPPTCTVVGPNAVCVALDTHGINPSTCTGGSYGPVIGWAVLSCYSTGSMDSARSNSASSVVQSIGIHQSGAFGGRIFTGQEALAQESLLPGDSICEEGTCAQVLPGGPLAVWWHGQTAWFSCSQSECINQGDMMVWNEEQ